MRPGEKLREIRNDLGMTIRDVEKLSARISMEEGIEEFAISNPWLTQIEKGNSVPSIHKLYSLSVILRVKFTDLLLFFGIDLDNIGKHQLITQLNKTHTASVETFNTRKLVTFPVRMDPSFRPHQTNLLNRVIALWGEVPIGLLQHLDLKHNQYGYIGLHDFMMYPILRPGSFVQIDGQCRKIDNRGWRTEFERPIYFLELRDGYACCWCELRGKELVLIPYPSSRCSTSVVRFPSEVDIVGQVVGVAMRFVPDDTRPPSEKPRNARGAAVLSKTE